MNYLNWIRPGAWTLAVAMVAAGPAVLSAATWNGSDDDYNVGTNWDTNAVPGETTDVTISSGVATFGGNLLRSAVTTIDGTGKLVVNGRLINSFDGGSGTINLAGNGELMQSGDYFIVSTRTFDGTFNQTGGTLNATINRGFFMTDGDGVTSESGVYNALGGVANVSMISGDAGNDLHNFQAGRRGANDAFVVDGGDVNFQATTENRRMYFSQDSTLDVSSGSFDADGFEYFVIGYGTRVSNQANLTGTARMLVSGGVATINPNPTGAFVVSDGQGGVVEVSGGTLNVGGELRIGGDVKANNGVGHGEVIQSAGAVNVTGDISIGPAGPGTYAMLGGDLAASELTYSGDSGSYFGFQGGTITLAGDDRSVVNESWFAAPFGANAVYDSIDDETTITRDPSVQNLRIEVDAQTGDITIRNPNPSFAIQTDYYEIRSAAGALEDSAWSSLDEQIPDGASSPTGDFNGDNQVDAADYTVWRDTKDTSVTPGTGADADGDGLIDQDDYELWKDNYGGTGVGTGWTEAGGSNGNLLAEYYLEEAGFSIPANSTYSLGSVFDTQVFGAGAAGDLAFSFETPGGYLVGAEVVYLNASPAVAVPEPTTVGLIAAATGLVALRRRF